MASSPSNKSKRNHAPTVASSVSSFACDFDTADDAPPVLGRKLELIADDESAAEVLAAAARTRQSARGGGTPFEHRRLAGRSRASAPHAVVSACLPSGYDDDDDPDDADEPATLARPSAGGARGRSSDDAEAEVARLLALAAPGGARGRPNDEAEAEVARLLALAAGAQKGSV